MTAPRVLVHVGDPDQPGRRLCDQDLLRLLPPSYASELERKVCPRCRERKRELAGLNTARVVPTPPARPFGRRRDELPLVAQMMAGMEPQLAAITAATVDAGVLGVGWIRITMGDRGPVLERIDPARLIVVEP